MANAYPELPVLPYQRTSVPMGDVITYLQDATFPVEVKRSTYCIFRIESANGQSGVNNNYAGMQADKGRWDSAIDHYFVGTTSAVENGTGSSRIFLCFATWQDSVACLADRLTARGLYVGGRTHLITQMAVSSATMLARAYTKEWATGIETAEPSSDKLGGFLSMYAQAVAFFRPSIAPTAPSAPPVVPTPPVIQPAPMASAEVASLRAALADIIVRAQTALGVLSEPPPATADPDNSADDRNAQVLAGIRGDAA